jgi:hypothetical protein
MQKKCVWKEREMDKAGGMETSVEVNDDAV